MKYKVILAIVGIFVIGAGLFLWNNWNHRCDPSYCDPLLPPDSLQLSANSVRVPLTVHVTGPAILLAKKNFIWNLITGCEFDIDWGDGMDGMTKTAAHLGDKQYCANALSHTYETPGTFVVKAYTFHPSPVDSRITDWTGTARVDVEDGSAQTATSTTAQNTSVSEITLVVGGNFQGTSYHVKDSKLIYSHSDVKGEQNSTTTLTSADFANLDSLLTRYKLDTLHTDPLPGPDMSYYYVMIIKDGKTYELRLVSSQNPGYALALELGRFFTQITKRISEKPCDPTKNCAQVMQATIKNSCAPWDGRALSISMDYKGGVFGAMLFAKGLDLFEAGKSVVINDSSDSTNGTGIANVCHNSTTCTAFHNGQVEIHNPTGVLKKGQTTRLNIIIDGVLLPVEAHWENSPQACG